MTGPTPDSVDRSALAFIWVANALLFLFGIYSLATGYTDSGVRLVGFSVVMMLVLWRFGKELRQIHSDRTKERVNTDGK